jgi:hypothetical protein
MPPENVKLPASSKTDASDDEATLVGRNFVTEKYRQASVAHHPGS